MSGSSTQSKIQAYPGDGDFFQRLNIKAATRTEACQILAKVLRDNAIERASGPSYQFIEAKWSLLPFDCVKDGETQKKGGPISWRPDEVFAGEMFVERDGERVRLGWDDLCEEPGWCKLDWVAVDADTGGLANASNVIDPTWESPDGEIVALDGYIDAYFQEVYLDQEELPTFAKVVANVSGDALDDYVEQLEGEVQKYLGHPNYGKVAKRMYNVFRYSGRHPEAAYVRELFDEPTVILYQVWSLLWTLENAAVEGSTIPEENVRAQADELVMTVVQALDGVQEEEIVGGAAPAADGAGGQPRGERPRGGRARARGRQAAAGQRREHVLPGPARRPAVDQGRTSTPSASSRGAAGTDVRRHGRLGRRDGQRAGDLRVEPLVVERPGGERQRDARSTDAQLGDAVARSRRAGRRRRRRRTATTRR